MYLKHGGGGGWGVLCMQEHALQGRNFLNKDRLKRRCVPSPLGYQTVETKDPRNWNLLATSLCWGMNAGTSVH